MKMKLKVVKFIFRYEKMILKVLSNSFPEDQSHCLLA